MEFKVRSEGVAKRVHRKWEWREELSYRIVSSAAVEAMFRLLLENFTSVINAVWPWRVCKTSPLCSN
jgi:hypothetical protein